MAYRDNYATAIIAGGNVIKDQNGVAVVPFGTEYSIRLRNRNDKKAVAKVFIDGEHVGSWIIPAHDYETVERPVHSLRKFKFVDVNSSEAEDADKPASSNKMGEVEVRWSLEAPPAPVYIPAPTIREEHHHHHHHYPRPVPMFYTPNTTPNHWTVCSTSGINSQIGSTLRVDGAMTRRGSASFSNDTKSYASLNASLSVDHCGSSLSLADSPAGCTVEGSQSNQNFDYGFLKTESRETVIRIKLVGAKTQYQQAVSHVKAEKQETARETSEREKLAQRIKDLEAAVEQKRRADETNKENEAMKNRIAELEAMLAE